MATRVSQQVRITRAVDEIRPLVSGQGMQPDTRKSYVRRITDSAWAKRTFSGGKTTAAFYAPARRSNSGPLDLLLRMSFHLVPAKWGRARMMHESWYRREMAWSLLALAQHKLGRDVAKALRTAYKKHGVKYRPRRTLTADQKLAASQNARKRFAIAKKPASPELIEAIGERVALLNRYKLAPKPSPTLSGRRRYAFDEEDA